MQHPEDSSASIGSERSYSLFSNYWKSRTEVPTRLSFEYSRHFPIKRGLSSKVELSAKYEENNSNADSSKQSDHETPRCLADEVLHVDGTCVKPIINRQIFVFSAPPQKVEVRSPPPVPKPKINYNIVFVRVPEQAAQYKPIVVPPPQQKTLVYVLNKRPDSAEQEIIEVTSKTSKPEVYFVNYDEGENPELPGGILLQDALSQSAVQGEIIDGEMGLKSLDQIPFERPKNLKSELADKQFLKPRQDRISIDATVPFQSLDFTNQKFFVHKGDGNHKHLPQSHAKPLPDINIESNIMRIDNPSETATGKLSSLYSPNYIEPIIENNYDHLLERSADVNYFDSFYDDYPSSFHEPLPQYLGRTYYEPTDAVYFEPPNMPAFETLNQQNLHTNIDNDIE